MLKQKLTPDELDFIDYFLNENIKDLFSSIVDFSFYHLETLSFYVPDRSFFLVFKEKNSLTNKSCNIYINFKVSHNHEEFIIFDIEKITECPLSPNMDEFVVLFSKAIFDKKIIIE